MYKFGELWNGLRSMLRLYEKMMKNVCRKYGLSMVEVDIIAFLKNHPMKDTAADIVEFRMLSKAAVSKGAELLIQKGLLERNPDQKDRRKVHLILTEDAQPIMYDVQQVQESYAAQLLDGFSEEEYETYIHLKGRILENVKIGEERGYDHECRERISRQGTGREASVKTGTSHGCCPADQYALQYRRPNVHRTYSGDRSDSSDGSRGMHAADSDCVCFCGTCRLRRCSQSIYRNGKKR